MKKRTRSLPSVLLACTLLSTMPFATVTVTQAADPAVTATVISKDDAVKKARDIANLPEANWKLTSVDQRSGTDLYDYNNRPMWVLQFNSTAVNTYAGVSVSIDSTNGQLLSLNRYSKGDAPSQGTLNREDAKKVAEAFLQKNAPEQFKQSELNDTAVSIVRGPYDGFYNFTYERKVNGVYVLGDQLSLSISSDGTVQNYMMHWTDAQFPAVDGPIDAATAKQAYADSLKLQLMYQEFYNGNPSAKLLYKAAYAPYMPPTKYYMPTPISYPIIDAKSGKLLDGSGKVTTSVNAPDRAPLVADGPTEPKPLSTPLTQEQAEQLVKSSGLLPDNVTLVSSVYNENGVYKMWNLSYQTPNANQKSPGDNYSFSIDAITGELSNYSSYQDHPTTDNTPHYTDDQLKAKAIDLVKTLFKDRTGALLQPTDPQNPKDPNNTMTDFSFGLLKNGVLTNDSVNVTYNAVTGNVQNIMGIMMMPDNNVTSYPSPEQVISADKAKEIYLQNRPLRLSYLFPITDTGISKTPVLVYTPYPSWGSNSSGVDAKTGEWYNVDNGSQQKPPVMPTDIKGHWAEKALTHYAELGLLELVDGKAHPDQKLTRAQVIRLLVDARNYGGYTGNVDPTFTDVPKDYKYFNQIETAVRQGWIMPDKKFRPDDTITREEVAAILARVEGYKDLSTHKEIFNVSYADQANISDWAYGSVAINYGLGVMRGANNKFDPKSDVTLAQVVTILDKLAALQNNNMVVYK